MTGAVTATVIANGAWHDYFYVADCAREIAKRVVARSGNDDPLVQRLLDLREFRQRDLAEVIQTLDGILHTSREPDPRFPGYEAARCLTFVFGGLIPRQPNLSHDLQTVTRAAMVVWLDTLAKLDPEGAVIVARWRVLDAAAPDRPTDERLQAATAAWLAGEYDVAKTIAKGQPR